MSNDNCRPCVEKDTSDAQLINCIQRSMAKFSWPRTGSSRCQERVAGRLIDQYGPMIADSATRVCRSVKGAGPVQASDVDAARQGARIGAATRSEVCVNDLRWDPETAKVIVNSRDLDGCADRIFDGCLAAVSSSGTRSK